jgi:hypothetical protein
MLEHDDLYQSIARPPIYTAPALPDGGDFKGIVNLHGSIRDPERMIFTDHDFGHAYLTRQYCARFLTELFSAYTVLFIGYSHDDPLMRYHARGLGQCDRFILTDEPDNDKWKTLDITPIPFKKQDYSEVSRILDTLANHISLGRGKKKTLIEEIAVTEPSLLFGYDLSLLRACFDATDVDGLDLLRAFLNNAKRYQWCKFIENDEVLKRNGVFQKVLDDALAFRCSFSY